MIAAATAKADVINVRLLWASPDGDSAMRRECGPTKSLVSPRGREGKTPQPQVVNKASVKTHGKPSSGFWLGSRVLRKFGRSWFLGTVDDISNNLVHLVVLPEGREWDQFFFFVKPFGRKRFLVEADFLETVASVKSRLLTD